MDREKVINELTCCIYSEEECECPKDCPYADDDMSECQAKVMRDALALLQEQGWIPITERLPKDDTDILVYCTDGEESRIVAVNYANGIWFDCIFNTVMVVKNITHWMPLPKPPTEGR